MFQPGLVDVPLVADGAAVGLPPAVRPERGDLLRLGRSLLRVYPFETRRRDEARTCPPRTVGWVSLVLGEGGAVGTDEAVRVCLRGEADPRSAEAAKEKVGFCTPGGETAIYQADRQQRSAALCACGNATAAAAALLAHHGHGRAPHIRLRLPDGEVEMRADVYRLEADSFRIGQTWSGIGFRLRQAELCGRRVAVCTGTFNDYLLVRLPAPEDWEAFGVEEAMSLWHAARRFGAFDDILRCRLVALTPNGTLPRAKFFTCGRAHPGAPLTGLATLALAAGHVDWLADMLAGGRIEHWRGSDALPDARLTPDGAEIEFPAIDVVLHGA